ncbi:TylF/MycF family methyltransferase [Pseudomonas sp. 18175]|uniref:TylF/MycF family methyltransferase n=1 Tax=Pseudomonas sp. 18175 TaxID=3390056 RepID=UPI003D1C3BD8
MNEQRPGIFSALLQGSHNLFRRNREVIYLAAERNRLINRYLTSVQDCLSGSIYEDPPLNVLGHDQFDAQLREYGWDWPSVAHTMIGKKRLANVRALTESVLGNNIEGDLIETGVWRGGACILMRAVLDAYCVTDRRVWVADSFEGLPPPDHEKYPADTGDTFHTYDELSVPMEQVMRNFEKYGLLDEQVVFLKGWFKDTLTRAPIEKLALLRLDGDMYESTMDALSALYDKVSSGGYVIVDDYNVVPACKQAVHDFLTTREFTPSLVEIDGVGVYWQVP